MKLKITVILLLIMMAGNIGYSLPRVIVGSKSPISYSPSGPSAVLQYKLLEPNNITAYFWSSGIFNQNLNLQNAAGFYWPKGSTNTACFTAGLCIAGYINTADGYKMGQVMASYKGEYTPGTIITKTNVNTSSDFKMYSVKSSDNVYTNPDVANWGKMVPYGAPFVDVNGNGVYDAGIDVPGQKNAAQTLFLAMNDAIVANHNSGEGFGGGVNDPLMYADARWTCWAYTSPGLEDLQFVRWVVINKNDSAWTRTYFSVVVDPDLGYGYDDYIGCDITSNMGFCYNGTDNDNYYGAHPPAFGMDYFRGPVNHQTGDTLGLTSFTFFTNNASSPPACESDPNGEPYPAYLNMTGVKKDSTPFLDPTVTNGSKKTKFCYPGDPETNNGWTEKKGSVQNCGGDTTTTNSIATNPPGDRRFIFSSGSQGFTVMPGDTQTIVLAQFVARGTSYLNSVTRLKRLDKTAQLIFDNNFNVTPPPATPVVDYTVTDLGQGLASITLNWGDASEKYKYWDTIFYQNNDSVIYSFEGYEVYEIDKNATSLPDFSKPETIGDQVKLLDIYDLRNGIGSLLDTFSTGVVVNGQEQFAPFPIVPAYKMTKPNDFPDHGIYRSITINNTQFNGNYSGQGTIIYGQEYQFAVVAYAVTKSTHIKKGFRVIRSSLPSAVIKITPVAPPAGTVYNLKNGDTINVNFPIRDLGLAPVVRNENLVQTATYRVVFNPDTTYNIFRKLATQSQFDTLKRNLKYVQYHSAADDSSRTIDGIYMAVNKIRFTADGSVGGYTGNVGVLQDVTSTLSPDSIQTRNKGWQYLPAANNPFKGATIIVNNQNPNWQSQSMSISYPKKATFNNVGSAVKPDRLRTIKIVFSNDPSKQQLAYRYIQGTNRPDADPSFTPFIINRTATNNFFIFQDKRAVPFTVWEVDPYDSTAAPRQLNCAFLENNDTIPKGKIDGQWAPTSDITGSTELLYIFNSNYGDPAFDAFYTALSRNLSDSRTIDIMYIWAPRLTSSNVTYKEGDEFYIYPYYATRPFDAPNDPTKPFFYEFNTTAPVFGDQNSAKNTNALDAIKIVPNPYYGFSTLDRSKSDKFVTFRHMPLNATVKIYTLNGDLVKTLNKTTSGDPSLSSTLEWNLQNQDNVPVASGIYIALIDAPGIGQKVMKIIVFTAQERINF
jgi:hypothetical protein